MRAILLAAGVGKRLRPITDTTPKCLIKVGVRTLLERHLEAFEFCGIKDIVIVVGHLAERVKAFVERHGPDGFQFEFVVNDRYKLGSILSLHAARHALAGGALVMDADVLYPPLLLARLVNSAAPSCLLMDRRTKATGEEMMLASRGGRVCRITRQPGESWEAIGEGVGFLKVSAEHAPILEAALSKLVEAGQVDSEYEEAVDQFLQQCEARYEDVSDLPWSEIDFVQDITRAEREILPQIHRLMAKHLLSGEAQKNK
jgi:choline kinase